MARTFRHDPDSEDAPREQRAADRNKRDARKVQHYTPLPVTQRVTQRAPRDTRTA